MNRHKRGIELQKILTKSILKKEYIDNKLSSHKIAEKYNTNHTTVNKYLKKYEFCIRNKSESLIGRKRDILTCQKISQNNKGKIPWNIGKKLTNKQKKNIVFALKSRNYKGSNHPNWKGGKPKCVDCDKKLSTHKSKRCSVCYNKYNSGKNHYNWKNGITKLILKVRNCFKYKIWRKDVFERDNYTCQICGQIGKCLEADHFPTMFSLIWNEKCIKTYSQALQCFKLWNISNGRTLCKKCHRKHGLRPKQYLKEN